MNQATESNINTPTITVQGAKLNTNVIETLKILQDTHVGYGAQHIQALNDVMDFLISQAVEQQALSYTTIIGYLQRLLEIRIDVESLALCYRHKGCTC